MVTGDPCIDLEPIIMFLDRFSWVYSFRWISSTVRDKHIYDLESALHKIPISWIEPLKGASMEDLKDLVRGTSENNNYPWPSDLQQFAAECRRFTRLISQNVCIPPTWLSKSTVSFNRTTNCVDFVPDLASFEPRTTGILYMTPKKSHEVARMTAFLQSLLFEQTDLLGVETVTEQDVKATDGNVCLTGTFQTGSLLHQSGSNMPMKHGM
ncbi:unnamed protein product [Echinostoma caproni]|uniref:Dynein_C domain-containing protein n=1 Tax=Echinostoma caproni TaxID=27848 RepID=A0A183B146_9TREM|nr:unnamed protein product [Echinostoma caproni]